MGEHTAPHATDENTAEKFPSICGGWDDDDWPSQPKERHDAALLWIETHWESVVFYPEDIISRFQRYRGVRPGPKRRGIYFLGLEQDIGYVGKASNIATRLWAHWTQSKDFTHYWCMTDIPKPVIDDIESFYIEWLDPPLNLKPGKWSSEFLIDKARELRKNHPWPPAV